MNIYYVIEYCPRCGIELPIDFGQDGFIDMIVTGYCYNELCKNEFEINLNSKEYNTYMIGYNNSILNIPIYKDYCIELLKYFKNEN